MRASLCDGLRLRFRRSRFYGRGPISNPDKALTVHNGSVPRVRDVLAALEQIAPARYAFSFDKVGLQVGDLNADVTKAVVSLDRSLGAIAYAAEHGCQLLLTHHPLIFTPLETVDTRGHVGRSVLELAKGRISFVAAHTNWDSARGGINDTLVDLLELEEARAFGTAAEVHRLKLVFFVPADRSQAVIDAASEAGAGVIGAYRRCAFSTSGTGTFVGDETTDPAVGEKGKRCEVPELRVEMVVPVEKRGAVERALMRTHPYEAPAYDFLQAAADPEQPAGRIAKLKHPMTLADLEQHVEVKLDTKCWTWGDPHERVSKIAVVGGAADGEWMYAQREGAHVLVTGEVRQHIAVEATESGMCLIAAGHYATEHPGSVALRARMAAAMPEIDWLMFTPHAGFHGRPF